MSSSRYVGRHGSARRSRLRLPSLGGARVGRTAAKSVAGVGIVLGCGAVVVAPTSAIGPIDASGALGVQQSSAEEQLAERDADSSSRSTERGAPEAVSAPTATKGAAHGSSAVDVEAVAEPKPKREPVEEDKDKDEEQDRDEEPDEEQDRDEEETDEEQDSSEDAGTEPSPTSTTSSEETRSSESGGSRSSSRSSSSSSPSSGSSSSSSSPQTGGYRSTAASLGLGPNAQGVYSAVRSQFPDMTNIGGYRAGDPGDHGSGKAVDIMVTGSRGDEVAAWLQQNASRLNITYIIWKQRIWHPGGSWESMSDRGDATQNHFDHVHVSVR